MQSFFLLQYCNWDSGGRRGHSSFCLISLTPSIITFVGIKIGYLQGVYELTTRPHGKNDDVVGIPNGSRRGLSYFVFGISHYSDSSILAPPILLSHDESCISLECSSLFYDFHFVFFFSKSILLSL